MNKEIEALTIKNIALREEFEEQQAAFSQRELQLKSRIAELELKLRAVTFIRSPGLAATRIADQP